MQSERIESLDDPRLDIFRQLKTTNATRDSRLFVAEGTTVVERVLKSGFEVRSVLISDRKFAGFQERLPENVPILRLRQELAEELVGFVFHSGVMASAVRRPAPPPGDWIAPTGPGLIVAGDRVTDPENVGALIRIGSAFGAAGVVFGDGSADPFSRRVLRVSMGNGLFLPIVETAELRSYLAMLVSDFGFRLCLTVLDPTAQVLSGFRFPDRTILVLGNEYDGISEAVRSLPAERLTIPMLNGTDSLNVAISSGIFLHQYRSQYPGV